jgi:hypothetical protein
MSNSTEEEKLELPLSLEDAIKRRMSVEDWLNSNNLGQFVSKFLEQEYTLKDLQGLAQQDFDELCTRVGATAHGPFLRMKRLLQPGLSNTPSLRLLLVYLHSDCFEHVHLHN